MKSTQHERSRLIVGVMIAVILTLRLVSILFYQGTGRVDPRVSLAKNQAQQIVERQRQQQVSAFIAIAEGEVSRTEERIREATALAMAVSLFAAGESLKSRTPATIMTVLSGVNNTGLMPPGLEMLNTQGEVSSSHGKLFVRYRSEPLGVEVLSLGTARLDGPAVLVRVGDHGVDEGAGLYLATRLDEITVPAPFASEAEVVAMGFASEPLRAAKLPRPDITK